MSDDNWSDMEIDEDICQLLDRPEQSSSGDNQCQGDQLETVITKSHQTETIHQFALRIHKKRLDSLLVANGLEKIPVYPDGNCFFNAASIHLENHTETTLRAALCQHVEDNLSDYLGFFHHEGTSNWDDLVCLAKAQLQDLRRPGVWNSAINDLMPLALANFTQRRIKIFSSKLSQPVIQVSPSLVSGRGSIFAPIYMTYLAVYRSEHYDGCVKTKRHLYTLFGSAEEPIIVPSSRACSPSLPPTSELEAQAVPASLPQQSPSSEPPLASPPSPISEPATPEPVSTPPPVTTPTRQCAGQQIENCPRTPSRSQDTAEPLRVYITPQKKTPPRKRQPQPEKWKKNSRKMLKLQGKEYVTSRGKIAKQKQCKPIDCKCRYKCTSNVTHEQQEAAFNTFYGLAAYERQKDYICRHVEQKETRTYLDGNKKPVINKRQLHRSFFLTVDGDRVQVCKKFFLATLDVGHGFVTHAVQNSQDGTFVGSENRGKHVPPNKTSEDDKMRVKTHIESFPAVESHYCRQGSKRKFLDSRLNINRMYVLYCEQCEHDKVEPVSSSYYREIFRTQYNLAFHKPKKDQCLICTRYREEKRANELTETRQKDYDEHQERKRESREEKEKDKRLAQKQEDTHTVTFDMEAVLATPSSQISQVHYKRKFAVYNLTIYSLSDKEASCYVWDECDGNKGSCEVATCLLRYLKSLPPNISHVILYSDTCGGQNRNKYVAAALHFAVKTISHIKIIDQKFLESGHSHMECDSIHATIEKAKKNASIFIPAQWHTVIEMARNPPYIVVPLDHMDFLDFKQLAVHTMKNTKKDTKKEKVNWLKIKWLRYTEDEDTVYFKYRMTEENFRMLKNKATTRRGRQQAGGSVHDIPRLYMERLAVSSPKKKDLIDLCEMGVIPQKYHYFYQKLPSSDSAGDRLPEPDMTELDEDSE